MTFRERLFHSFYNQILPLILVALCVVGVWISARSLEPLAFDRLITMMAPRIEQDSPVELVLLDDASISALAAEYGPPPWPWTVYQAMFDRLQQQKPAVVAFATSLNHKNAQRFRGNYGSDTAEEQALPKPSGSTSLVLGAHLARRQLLHLPSREWYGLNLGVVNLDSLTWDGVIRSLSPYWMTLDSEGHAGLHPSLALISAYDYLNTRSARANSPGWLMLPERANNPDGGELLIQTETSDPQVLALPLNSQQRMLLRWYAPIGATETEAIYTHPATPMSHFFPELAQKAGLNSIPNSLDANRFRNKILVVGSASSVYRDTVHTPVANQHLAADVHATGMHNILSEGLLKRAPNWQRSLVLLLSFFLLFAVRLRYQNFTRGMLYSLACFALYFWFVAYQLVFQQTVYDIVTPGLFMVLGYLFGMLRLSSAKAAEVQTLTSNMAQLVAPSVFEEVVRQKKGIEAGGQRLTITVLMVDIRGFTSLAENLPANEVTDLLNAFYSEVERVIFRHHGTIDKYLGDGVMVLFGAPLETPEHAQQGLNAALELLDAMDELADRWWRQRHIFFHIGISLNSGFAFVGFVGPPQKLEYTALGDTVNLAARLQDHNKALGEQLLFTEYTLDYLPETEPLLEQAKPLGAVRIRGRATGVVLYTLPRATKLTDPSLPARPALEPDDTTSKLDPLP